MSCSDEMTSTLLLIDKVGERKGKKESGRMMETLWGICLVIC